MKTEPDKQCISFGYAQCKCIKKAIDDVLEANAQDRMQLGISSTKAEINAVKKAEIARLKSVRHLDKEKIDRLLDTI
jgi:hypothetical protein